MRKALLICAAVTVMLAGASTAGASSVVNPQQQFTAQPTINSSLPNVVIRQGNQLIGNGGQIRMDLVVLSSNEGWQNCDSGYVCLWWDSNYKGRRLEFASWNYWQNLGGSWGSNDEISSWRNRASVNAKLSWNTNGVQPYTCLQSGARSSGMGGWNDNASSLWINSVCRGS